MKLEYVGGNIEEIPVTDSKGQFICDEDGTPTTEKRDQLTQILEEMEYHWPEPGSVISVPDNVGAWLIGKLGALVRPLPAEKNEAPRAAPRRIVAVVPEKKAEKADATPGPRGRGAAKADAKTDPAGQ